MRFSISYVPGCHWHAFHSSSVQCWSRASFHNWTVRRILEIADGIVPYSVWLLGFSLGSWIEVGHPHLGKNHDFSFSKKANNKSIVPNIPFEITHRFVNQWIALRMSRCGDDVFPIRLFWIESGCFRLKETNKHYVIFLWGTFMDILVRSSVMKGFYIDYRYITLTIGTVWISLTFLYHAFPKRLSFVQSASSSSS